MKKILISTIFCLFTLIVVRTSVFAAIPKSTTKNFGSLMNDYFAETNSYAVINKNGDDISNAFYLDNIKSYQSSDYNSIESYTLKNVSCFSKTTITKAANLGVPNAFTTRHISKEDSYIASAKSSVYDDKIKIKCFVTLSASFTYNFTTGKITGCSDPTLSFDYDTMDFENLTELNVRTDNISTESSVSSDKYSVTFSSNYDVIGTYLTFDDLTFAKNKRITMTGTPE
ncbi:hypothetical protein EQM14_01145 [Caproiciproducens sp. NJN-50]|uniref:hypothetical protein n=1 Tax=Acutalibacteraceae TaxID=3082771 RepID=UPI000FFE1931|nr:MULTISPECIES: hypothetical protein [Acutalibacteraceae]QAT48492.1 hypothetical protein EQM14_01145 [Caproiciproducens sp. NJN-50]